MSLEAYKIIKDQIVEAAVAAERDPAAIMLVAVTKGHSWASSSFLYDGGQRDFGENKVVDALEKISQAPSDSHWHLIGSLQSNKVRKVIGKFALIHSVDSVALAKKVSEVSGEQEIQTSILLQSNTSGEASKHGLTPDEWMAHIDEIAALQGIKLEGLMTMAPLDADPKAIAQCFGRLRMLRDDLERLSGRKLPHLSMGMSRDFKIAIAEGATIVRIGSLLF